MKELTKEAITLESLNIIETIRTPSNKPAYVEGENYAHLIKLEVPKSTNPDDLSKALHNEFYEKHQITPRFDCSGEHFVYHIKYYIQGEISSHDDYYVVLVEQMWTVDI